jgi:hypothetical protein
MKKAMSGKTKKMRKNYRNTKKMGGADMGKNIASIIMFMFLIGAAIKGMEKNKAMNNAIDAMKAFSNDKNPDKLEKIFEDLPENLTPDLEKKFKQALNVPEILSDAKKGARQCVGNFNATELPSYGLTRAKELLRVMAFHLNNKHSIHSVVRDHSKQQLEFIQEGLTEVAKMNSRAKSAPSARSQSRSGRSSSSGTKKNRASTHS